MKNQGCELRLTKSHLLPIRNSEPMITSSESKSTFLTQTKSNHSGYSNNISTTMGPSIIQSTNLNINSKLKITNASQARNMDNLSILTFN